MALPTSSPRSIRSTPGTHTSDISTTNNSNTSTSTNTSTPPITTTATGTTTTTNTAVAMPVTVTAEMAQLSRTAPTSPRSSPPKDDSPTGRSKKTTMPRSPRPMPVPALRLRSTSSSMALSVSPRKLAQSLPSLAAIDDSQQPGREAACTGASGASNSVMSVSSPVLQTHSAPTLQIFRTRMPMRLLKKSELESKLTKLADLLVNDVLSGDVSAANLKVLGRVDSAFYIEHLPAEFTPFGQGLGTPTIACSKLLQRFFAVDFRTNLGWGAARTLYKNFQFDEIKRASSSRSVAVGEADPDTKRAEMERMQGRAEVIVRTLLGFPPTIEQSPLPAKMLRLLVICDQRLHEKLLSSDGKISFSTDQIRSARLAMLTNLVVTRLLQPMLSSLAAKQPTQSEMWFLTLLMKGLVSAVQQFSDALFSKSFASSPLSLQQRADEKLRRERIDARIRQLQSKPTVRHVRTRSADTEPISPRTLRTIEEARSFRSRQKAAETARTMEAQDWSVLDDTRREIDENLAIAQASADLQDFDAADLRLVLSLLDQRTDSDDLDFILITPRRAQPLEDSDDGPGATVPPTLTPTTITTTTTSSFTTTTTSTTGATVTAAVTAATAATTGAAATAATADTAAANTVPARITATTAVTADDVDDAATSALSGDKPGGPNV